MVIYKACTLWCLSAGLTSALRLLSHSAVGTLAFLLLLGHSNQASVLEPLYFLFSVWNLLLQIVKCLIPLLPWGPFYLIREALSDTTSK